MKIGFIGQGFIGKHMADDFAERGYSIVRYALEPLYVQNKGEIATCDIVFIAVPTPTTPDGFDDSALRAVLPLVGVGKIAVVKSTVLPGRTRALQAAFPDRIILHSPEFLREKSAKEDTKSPARTIVGIPEESDVYRNAAAMVVSVLPESPYTTIVTSDEAELIKYAGNCFLAMKVIFMNVIYDAAAAVGADYQAIIEAMQADPRIGSSHMQVIDTSGHPGSVPGRGAGGHCFPKDLEAFKSWYDATSNDAVGTTLLAALLDKNNSLLRMSGKDLELLRGIYGH